MYICCRRCTLGAGRVAEMGKVCCRGPREPCENIDPPTLPAVITPPNCSGTSWGMTLRSGGNEPCRSNAESLPVAMDVIGDVEFTVSGAWARDASNTGMLRTPGDASRWLSRRSTGFRVFEERARGFPVGSDNQSWISVLSYDFVSPLRRDAQAHTVTTIPVPVHTY